MELYQHQKDQLAASRNFNRVAYYHDMGLGKTYTGSEKANSFPQKILVICQHSKIDDWISHFRDNYPLIVYDLTDKAQLEAYCAVSEKCVGVINYELAFRRPALLSVRNFTLVLDESSMIQNEKAQRSKFILKMEPENVVLLSGTPTSGKYEKLWSQLHLLGWKISKDLFYKQYVEIEWIEDHESGFRIPHVTGYKNVDRLKQKLAQYGAFFLKTDEVLTLPEQNFITIETPSTSDYRRFMRNSVITIGAREYVGDTLLAKRTYARMMCGHLNPNRIAAFRDLVESTEDRLIVFYTFNDELAAMESAVEPLNRPVSVVNGEDKDLEAYEECPDSITFVQYQAGAMGLNLQKANKIIYFSPTDRSELHEQSKKRIHRIGQNNPCFYYQLICPGTIEENILETLQLRKDYTDELFKAYNQKNRR